MVDAEVLVDFAGALALIGMLSLGYGILVRRTSMAGLGPALLGAMFGMVAILGMLDPLSPLPGVIVDMRCVPVALAGAFLGKRGLAVCLALTVAVRLSLGGDGAVAGVAAITVAGLAGLAWRLLVPPPGHRTLRHFFCLAALTSVHLSTGALLPPDAAAWFFTAAAPALLALNLAAIPLFAALLDHEMRTAGGQDVYRHAKP